MEPRTRYGWAHYESIADRLACVADGIAFAHRHGVIHRDIKPSNLLLSTEGGIQIVDFGLARQSSSPELTKSGELLGTPHYMAPEQVESSGVTTHQVDIYGLGATLYEWLTGQPPFRGENRETVFASILFERMKPPRSISAEIPADLETICLKATERNPADRYAVAEELAADLRRFVRREPILASRPSPLDRCVKWIDRHRALAASIAAFPLCIAIIATLFAIRNHRLAMQLQAETSRANYSVFEASLEHARAARRAPIFGHRSTLEDSISRAKNALDRIGDGNFTDERHALTDEAVAAFAMPSVSIAQVISNERGWSPEVTFSRDLSLYAHPSIDGQIRISTVDGETVQILRGPERGTATDLQSRRTVPELRSIIPVHTNELQRFTFGRSAANQMESLCCNCVTA